MAGVVVRSFARDEWRAYRALRLTALADAPDAFCTTEAQARARSEADWIEQLTRGADSPDERPMVAMQGDAQVGMGWCLVAPDRTAELFQMWVEPGARRAGVGRAIVDDAVHFARERRAACLVLGVACDNDAARRLYESAGFVDAGAREPLRPGSARQIASMRLDFE